MTKSTLPIGVVLPVLNCRPELPGHLAGSASWLPWVEQVVVVDSFSSDGSLDYLRAELKHPQAQFLSHPPGLYQSWNFGISQIESKYLYVSTIGDLMSIETLKALCEAAERFNADVVLSPPQLVAPGGEPISHIKWPIHEMIAACDLKEPNQLDPVELFTLAAFYATAGGLKSVMGSSASNLYRTQAFKENPFPTDFSVIGDTVWGLRHMLESRVAIYPHEHSRFVVVNRLVNDKLRSKNSGLAERLEEEALQILLKDALTDVPEWNWKRPIIRQMFAEWKAYSTKRLRLEAYRKDAFPWVLRPAAWRLRMQRKQHQARFKALCAEVLPPDKASLLHFAVK
ncbi:MAG: glycosyltransferase family 2 protein [Verrucomicrobiales bacterium]